MEIALLSQQSNINIIKTGHTHIIILFLKPFFYSDLIIINRFQIHLYEQYYIMTVTFCF